MAMILNLELLRDAVTIFQGILIEAIPFLLLGVIASAFVHIYVKSETLIKLIPQSRWGSILVGPMMGFLFPVCECGNIPLARRMIKKGIPIHTVVAFLFAAPVFNPVVILATYAAFANQPMVVVWRVVLSLIIAMIVSWAVSWVKNKEELLTPGMLEVKDDHQDCECKPNIKTKEKKFSAFTSSIVREFLELGALLVLGALIASFTQALIPREWIAELGQGPIMSIVAMMLMAALISICSNVDAFFVLSYVNTFSMGSIMAFLVFGPMIDIKVFIMLPKIFRLKVIIYITILIAQLVFFFTAFYNLHLS